MGKILRILKRDIKRIISNKVAVLVMFGIFLIPSLYAWFNIWANYDPYSSTGGVEVAVVNMDKKVSEMGIDLDAGKELVDELSKNKKLGWVFCDYDEALEGVKAGNYYAAIVVPEDFSSCLLSIVSGEIKFPKIVYYVNEKKNAIAPKITDAGITTIENTMNMQFSETVSKTLSGVLKRLSSSLEKKIESDDTDIVSYLDKTESLLKNALSATEKLNTDFKSLNLFLDEGIKSNKKLKKFSSSSKSDLENALDYLKKSDNGLDDPLMDIYLLFKNFGDDFKDISDFSDLSLKGPYEKIILRNKRVSEILGLSSEVLDAEKEVLDDIKSFAPSDSIFSYEADILRGKIEKKEKILNNLTNLNEDAKNLLLDDKEGKILKDSSFENFKTRINELDKTYKNVLKSKNNLISENINSLNKINSILSNFPSMIDLSDKLMVEMKNVNEQGMLTVSYFERSIKEIMEDVSKAKNDISIFKNSKSYQTLSLAGNLNTDEISYFMKSPAKLETVSAYPVKNYGSAMAPFYTNLAIWVGGIVLIAILKLEVDSEGFDEISQKEKYFSRLFLFLIIGIIQAIIVSAGDIYFLKVQCDNPLLLIFSAVLCSIVYVNIIFCLSLTFKHIGKALCVLLVILQIPGGSGTYPIEMTPEFFQKIFPFLPFNYGINIFRQCMFGIYSKGYVKDMVSLLAFVPVSLLIGIFIRPALFNLNALFDKKLSETGFMVYEDEDADEESLDIVISALASNPDIRAKIVKKANEFNKNYSKRIKRGFLAIFFLPLFFLILMFNVDSKIIFLILWIASIVLIDGYLIFLEYVHDKLNRQLKIYSKDEEELKKSLDIFSKEDRK